MRIIHRYNNRKLYDAEQHRYITTKDIAEMTFNEVNFQVVDREGGDRTKEVLISALRLVAVGMHETELINLVRRYYEPDKIQEDSGGNVGICTGSN